MSTPDIATQERAAGLAQMNAALEHSLDLLANESDLDGFLGRMLCEIGVRLDAGYVLMWLADGESGTAVPRLAWSDVRGPGSADDLLPPRLPGAQVELPLSMGEDSIGGITVLSKQTGQLPAAEIAWAQVFAHQATLALRLERLSADREASAVAKERARIARDIHDGIAQAFIGIHRHLRSAGAPADSLAVAKAIELAKDGLAESRRTVRALGPRQLGNMSFLDAVEDIAGKVIPPKIRFLVSSTGTWPALPPEKETHLFRVVQEAFNNVARHSFATQLNLDVSATPGELSILIQDNGRGFDLQGKEAGFGLACMRQRMDAIDGFFEVSSAPGSGTQVFIRLARV